MAQPENSADRPSHHVDESSEPGQDSTAPASSAAHLAELRELLTEDRARAVERIASLSRDFTSIVEEAQLTATDDEHDPEGSTIAFERSQTSALLTAATERVADVDAALARIADGSYGHCERCGEPIAHERLLARPTTRTCIACAASSGR